MPRTTITASAPGTLMISGEHAVLHNHPALAGAVDRRISVSLIPCPDDTITIASALGERKMNRGAIDASPPFTFAGAILNTLAPQLPSGCHITIDANMRHDVGLGSSAAVTVALLAALRYWIDGTEPDKSDLMREAIAHIRSVQGMGSGTDVAACVHGGIVLYTADPPTCLETFAVLPPITLIYAGYKTPTPEVIRHVEQLRAADPDRFESLFNQFDTATTQAAAALRLHDWATLGRAIQAGQTVMEGLGVCDATLERLITTMAESPAILGAKISGSGLGDCIIGIGTLETALEPPCRVIPACLSPRGVEITP
jgi:mevalonate kinase